MAAYSKRTILNFLAKADAATTSHDKGRLLEDLVCYVFERIPGIALTQRNVKNTFDTLIPRRSMLLSSTNSIRLG